ncbi:acyl-CoA thioesterase [Helicobacter aurati]|uniref:Acyl-CoA thioesterase n=1 Tax=Helicobacter aurati TaxID=137778 RepID=A0A3D8J8M9_9HELI|nr:acyl-CoA thioesterase [Helicobacter aurati]RDU73640.1 acyl-CoA thioesterase [Helicobacter aurati]
MKNQRNNQNLFLQSKAILTQTYTLQTEFFDVDSMGVVWHGNYVKYLESARCRFLESLDCTYTTMRYNGFVLPVVKIDMKYIKPLQFNQKFNVEVGLLEWESFLRFQYVFKNLEGQKLFLAHSSQVAVLLESQETCFCLPKILRQAIESAIQNKKRNINVL